MVPKRGWTAGVDASGCGRWDQDDVYIESWRLREPEAEERELVSIEKAIVPEQKSLMES